VNGLVKDLVVNKPMLRDFIIISLLLAIAPFFSSDYYITVISSAIIYAIFAISFDLAWGYMGILTLGHSLFLGLGAYTYSIMQIEFGSKTLAIIVAILIPSFIGFLVSQFLFFKKTTPFFIGIVTLALTVIAEQGVLKFSTWTGGQNGLTGFETIPLAGTSFYFFLLVVLVIVFAIVYYLTKSDFGKLIVSIRDNEERVQFLGFKVPHIKTLVFVISASIAGFAGILFANFNGFVSTNLLAFSLATQVIIWVAIGGRGRIVGAIIGALLINILTPIFNTNFPYLWQMLLGLFFILVVLFIPNGIYSLMKKSMQSTTGFVTKVKDEPLKNTNSNDALKMENVSVSFGDLHILKELNLVVKPGEIQCIVGPNGAGKSTLINAITGRNPASKGKVTFNSTRLDNLSPQDIVSNKVARTFQTTSIINDITVAENLQLAAYKGKIPTVLKKTKDVVLPAITLDLLKKVNLAHKLDEVAENLSHGEQQALELCMVMALEPTILLLDEPTAGLTQTERKDIGKMFKELAHEKNVGLVIIEHDMDFVKEIADRVTVLYDGRIAADGSVREITESTLVKEIYLGTAVEGV